MSVVFECRNLHKRFIVGAGSCNASAHVLRGVDLSLHAGDCVAIVGPRGAGKSTLLLCAAGLLRPDAGEVSWYGQPSPTRAPRSISYHWTTVDFPRVDGDAGIHLVDFSVTADRPPRLAEWIVCCRDAGEAIIFGTRDESTARALASRVVFLRSGRLGTATRSDAVSRVAEPVA